MKLKVGDRVRVTDRYPAYDLLAYHTGSVHSMKVSHTHVDGVVMAVKLDFDDGPGGEDGLVFYDYELEKMK